ncbi:MAG: MFS transporter [Pseudomonadota bacterium]
MLSRRVLLAYAAPALPMAALYFPVYVFLAPFYAGTFGLSVTVIGAVLIAIRLMDAVTDPLMGWLSDRTRWRFGRRKTWMALATPVIMVAVIGLLAPPDGVGLGWFTAFLVALTLGWTMFLTPYFAWGAEMSGNYGERGKITVWRESVGLIGTIIAAVIYGVLGERLGLSVIAAAVAIGLPVAAAIALRGVPETRALTTATPQLSGILSALRDEPIFRRLLIAYFINGAANALPATLFLFFVDHRLGATSETGGLLLIVYFGAAVLAAPFWSWVAGRFQKHKAWCVAMVYAAAVFLCALTLGEGDVLLFTVIAGLSGLALGADLSLPTAMQADVVDLDTQRSGQHRTGAFFAVWSVATKASVALTGGLALIILGAFGFDANAQNSEMTLWVLALLYAGAPVVLKLWAIALMWGFPLDRARQEEIRRGLEAGPA